MFRKYKHIHFIGIGGVGMSGIADVLMTLGYNVSGSDLKQSAVTRKLKRRGAHIFHGHSPDNVAGADVVVVSSAISDTNVELLEAKRRGIPIVLRAEMLAELMRLKYSIVISGTHGKTTTTSMIATVLFHAGFDPTMVIGGKVNSFRTNARLGKGEFIVAEADESDRSFLKFSPTIAVITNIDPEHMENYRDLAHVKDSYVNFASKVPFYGCVVCGIDNPNVRDIVPKIERKCITFGIQNPADYTASDIRQVEDRLQFIVNYKGKRLGVIRMNLAGRHNVENALAAIAVGMELDIPFNEISYALSKFKGVERRFQILYRRGPIIVNDYSHHPSEIAATIRAAREGWPEKRIVFIHQPHRYTRLKFLFKEFVDVLSRVDKLVLLKLYPASEKAIAGVGSRQLYISLRRKHPKLDVTLINDNPSVVRWVRENVDGDDLVIFSGAGDIWQYGKETAKMLK